MPKIYDFGKLRNVKIIEVNPLGWVSPLFIEYGIDDEGMPSCCWRVKGTKHTFIIPIGRLDYLSEGNYKTHFEKTLEGFRKEYLEWREESFYTGWQQQYKEEYSLFIIV
jgi:hypothetical protein